MDSDIASPGFTEQALAAAPGLDDRTGLTADIDDPDTARTARLEADALTIDLVWEPELDLATIRAETYSDAYGTGLRLGIAAATDTATGPDCLNARATAAGHTTTLQWCTHTVQHPPVDMAAFLGKETTADWAPDRLYLTETANLAPPAGAVLVDYLGFGVNAGDAHTTGLWPDGMWSGADHHGDCDHPDQRRRLDDLHLTDRHADPAEHRRSIELVDDPGPAHPAEGRLLTLACAATANNTSPYSTTMRPFFTAAAADALPFSGTAGFNASTRTTQPVRIAAVVDLRTCDTSLARCTADSTAADPDLWWVPGTGPGTTWMADLLA